MEAPVLQMRGPMDHRADRRRDFLRRAGLVGLALSSSHCGYLLYPERKGRSGGRVDAGVLIIDLLWLIPGLVPGAVCLIVDFTTGCIYERPEVGKRDEPGRAGLVAEVHLDGRRVARARTDYRGQVQLELKSATALDDLRARGELRVLGRNRAIATGPLASLL